MWYIYNIITLKIEGIKYSSREVANSYKKLFYNSEEWDIIEREDE